MGFLYMYIHSFDRLFYSETVFREVYLENFIYEHVFNRMYSGVFKLLYVVRVGVFKGVFKDTGKRRAGKMFYAKNIF